MRILRARVRNYRAIQDLELQFTDRLGAPQPVTVLAGPNGCGKTSLLFAITNALRGVLGYRTDDVPVPCRDDIRFPVGSATGWTTTPPEIRVEVDLHFDEIERQRIPDLYRVLGQPKPPPLPGDNLRVTWSYPPSPDPDGSRPPWWYSSVSPSLPNVRFWLTARQRAIRAWLQRRPGIRATFLDDIGGLWFFPQDRNLQTRVLGDQQGGRRAAEQDFEESSEPNRGKNEQDDEYSKERARFRTVSEILHYLSDYARGRVENLPDERNFEKRIQDLFDAVCTPKRYRGYLYRQDDPLGAPILQDGSHEYPLSHAASGEQVILEYITRLSFPRPMNRSVVIIDEPEVHLHPTWVRQLYLALPKLGETNQYILSSHSPELRKRSAADNALIDLGELGNGA
ncbi:MAG: AAA family ATPase [Planctomycetes bacterium]|nr:AAA family ATPase [Planctomycetota bacterium]